MVYRGPSEGGDQLWVRRWDALEPLPIRGTEGGVRPSVSPEGGEVAFVQGGEVRVVSLQGGPVRTLMAGLRPHWGSDGYVYATVENVVVRVLPTGGPTEPVTELREGDQIHYLVDVLPGGKGGLLQVGTNGGTEVRALRIDTGELTWLAEGLYPRYATSGHIVFVSNGGTLMAARFDPDAMESLGQPVALQEDIAAFSLSDTGKLFYSGLTGGQRTEFVWVTRSGLAAPVDPGWTFDAGTGNPAWSLSPDGTRLALRAVTEDNVDIWVKDLDDGPLSRLTFDESQDWSPYWTPDGETVTFVSIRAGDRDVWMKRADGTGAAELLYDHESRIVEGFWSPDGEWLVLRGGAAGAAAGTRDILAMRPGVDEVAQPLLAEEYDERAPALSPDGRWLAYTSNETGSNEVFVRPFPDVNSGRWQISTDGGIMPVWAHSGRELFFVDRNSGLVTAEINTAAGFQVGGKQTLFTLPVGYHFTANNALFGVAPDDQRFLMARDYQDPSRGDVPVSPFVLVQNFTEELKSRVPN